MPEAAPTSVESRIPADDVLLEIQGLKTHFNLDEGLVRAIDGVDFDIRRGQTLCVVGESGCGKSMTARSILQIVQPPGKVVAGQMLFHRRDGEHGDRVVDLARLDPKGKEIRTIRGKEISMIFQEPMTSLSPVHTVGNQIAETVILHEGLSKQAAKDRAIEMLGYVGIPRPQERIDSYPFEMSGGMRQRAMIAMALACTPTLLIADEPTTALDVTTQAQILELIQRLKDEFDMAVMLITHDLGVVAEVADDVVVMYLGQVVEQGSVDDIFHDPKHPYTRALLKSIPRLGQARQRRLDSIAGMVPSSFDRPSGCPFHTRCPSFMPGRCDRIEPDVTKLGPARNVRCLLYEPDRLASDEADRRDLAATPGATA
ncbi:MAG: ABC transporter ATP-binding protein [Thermomicrobiales bacterium]